jgi:hypothetical protein
MNHFEASATGIDASSPLLAAKLQRGLIDPPGFTLPRAGAILIPAVIGIVAFFARLLSLARMGGFRHLMGYDEGVYFGAATGLVHGLMPYRDFVFVHPPGILALLSPFATLSSFTSDTTGWTAARLAIMGVGAANAILVYLIARRVSLVAALVAGGLYAVWSPAVWVERTTMLEAFVLLGTLMALWAIRDPDETTRRLILGGAFLGLASSVKLWGLVPLVVIIVWLLISRAWKSAAWVAGAAAVTMLVIVGPFFALAPHRMFEITILGQINREGGGTSRLGRVGRMLNIDIHQLVVHPRLMQVAAVAAALVILVAVVACWRSLPLTRLWSSLLVVQGLVLMSTPVYFKGYSSFIAPALLLVVGSGAALMWHRLTQRSHVPRALGVGALTILLLIATVVSIERSDVKESLDHAAIAAAQPFVKDARCVGSDSAGVLVLSDVLTRNLDNGCLSVFDFNGTIYSVDGGGNPGSLSAKERRLTSVEYQRLLQDYIHANDVMLLHRGKSDGLSPETRAILKARPLLMNLRGLKAYGPGPAQSPTTSTG